ncbi:hypothetical protein T265_11505 [Opisthorchis viverrini]|uniref:Uncharacterized protein n=1 Tax=Opisthorchis viverrini TaxID=6198 RepID=A0A074YYD5_OPIVI|nr:hypothetical protein T265_11505 [Opisthorchis viverrini]KER19811.1 hypothetical protein T265_11505 [Opisthorchis viverrini]
MLDDTDNKEVAEAECEKPRVPPRAPRPRERFIKPSESALTCGREGHKSCEHCRRSGNELAMRMTFAYALMWVYSVQQQSQPEAAVNEQSSLFRARD